MVSLENQQSKWILKEETTDAEVIAQNETLFALSNGHFGTRGSLEERKAYKETYGFSEATLINGYFDSEPIQYGEWAYGYAENHQTVIPVPHAKHVLIEVDGEKFNLEEGKNHQHLRELNLKEGILTREVKWESPKGHMLTLNFERFASYAYPEIYAQRISVSTERSDVEIIVTVELDDLSEMAANNLEKDNDPRIKAQKERRFHVHDRDQPEQTDQFLHIETKESHLHLLLGLQTACSADGFDAKISDRRTVYSGQIEKGKAVHFEQFVGYSTPFGDEKDFKRTKEHLLDQLGKVAELTYDGLKEEHINDMQSFWDKADIQIEGDDTLQLGLRFNLFHLNQAAARDGKRNMSAKGLTGEGYEGHYFWDTEMYMLPFFIYTQPEVAKQLLSHRYSILDKARERARVMASETGALFAWRTINGEEASPYYPAGTAQIHINGDIAHAIDTYVQATNDTKFKWTKGLEMVVETARFYYNWGHFDASRDGAFVINDVTGPDEYTAIVNNNYYTNLIAKHNLMLASAWIKEAKEINEASALVLLKKIGLEDSEIEGFEQAADLMHLPYDEEQQLSMQDDSFFNKKVWDFENTPKENYPLLLNYHPLTIYKHQVNKQADTVLAHLLFPNDFTVEQKARDYDYYEAVTTHDSSLSRSIFGIVASALGRMDKAYSYFMDTALMDITDMQSNTKDGVHAANMGGTWMSMVIGFGGMKVKEGTVSFEPRLPKQWDSVRFKVQYQGRLIQLEMTHDSVVYTLLEGETIQLHHFEETNVLKDKTIYSI